jgi:hypothetical protein
MFFQWIIYVAIVIGGVWAIWHFIGKDILNSPKVREWMDNHGIIYEEPEEIKTVHTQELDKMREKLGRLQASADAATMTASMSKEMRDLEKEIAKAEKIIEKNS